MNKLKKLFRILLYLSFGFIIYYLYSFDYIIFSELIFNPSLLILSLLFLWSGFVTSALSWKNSLNIHQIKIAPQLAIFSHGISVFAKYIPGKVWVILGRASVVSEKTSSFSVLSAISLKEQLVYLLTGLVISLFAIIWLPVSPLYSIFVGTTVLFLFLLLFSKSVHSFFLLLVKKVFKKNLEIPYVSLNEALPMLKTIIGYWILWSSGFYLLVLSVLPDAPLIVTFAFPLSVCYGLLAIVVPGGIGIRESIIVFFLTKCGIEPSLAVTLSLIQRLWFITGEMFIFGFALILRNKIQKREN
jgi:hypothetical protein